MDRELHITLAAATGFEPLRAPIDQAHALPMARMSAVCGANPTGRRADRLARCDALCGADPVAAARAMREQVQRDLRHALEVLTPCFSMVTVAARGRRHPRAAP